MICLLQRVSGARVEVDQQCIGEIGQGLVVLVGVQKDDNQVVAAQALERVLNYRVFSDQQGKMNLSVRDVEGGLLLVPQFTLAADTRKGRRPSFTSAAPSQQGQLIFEELLQHARQVYGSVASGQFGADMQVSLTNDGPVTFILD